MVSAAWWAAGGAVAAPVAAVGDGEVVGEDGPVLERSSPVDDGLEGGGLEGGGLEGSSTAGVGDTGPEVTGPEATGPEATGPAVT